MKRFSLVCMSLFLAVGLCIPSSVLVAFAAEVAQPAASEQPVAASSDAAPDVADGARVEPGPRGEGAPDVSGAPAVAPDPAAEAQPNPAADIPAAPAEPAPNPPAPAPADNAADTGSYDISVTLAGERDTFHGGEWITLYNNVSISGNDTILEEGSYTVISLPKNAFPKPSSEPNVSVSTTFERFKSFEVVETDDAYLVKTYHKQLTGGYTAGTPIKTNFIPRQVINGSDHLIKQELFDASGTKLAENQLTIHSKAQIETLGDSTLASERLIAEVDASFVTKPGTYKEFSPNVYTAAEDYNDPRDRRIYAEIPAGTTIKPDTGWTYDADLGKWYKDMKRDKFAADARRGMRVDLDISGIDFSQYNRTDKVKSFTVNYSIQVVVDGVVQGDLAPVVGKSTRSYYVLKEEPAPPATTLETQTGRYSKTIKPDYTPANGSPYSSWKNQVTIPYPLEQLAQQRIRYSHQLLKTYRFSNAHDDAATRELTIKGSTMDFSTYVSPAQLRILVTGRNQEDTAALTAKLAGTKAYGIAQDGSETLLSSNVPIVTSAIYETSFTADGYQSFVGGEAYKSIRFEYPEGLTFVGQDQIDKFAKQTWTDVVCDLKEGARSELVEKLETGVPPYIFGTGDYARTNVSAKFVKESGSAAIGTDRTVSDYSQDNLALQYDSIASYLGLKVGNGRQFFTDDTLTTEIGYSHTRNGRFADANTPENINIYYLVPDGLEPAEEGGEASTQWESIRVQRGYKPGYNLVIAKPKGYKLPKLSLGSGISSAANNYRTLRFKATERVAFGEHTIQAALLIDNNKLDVKDGKQYGILQYNTPSGLFETITNDAANRSEDRAKYTNLGSTTFNLYPPKVLYGLKSVKMASAPDSAYASSVGEAATIGDAVDYQWLVTNNSTREVNQLTVIDVLPYAGDKAIVANQEGEYRSRGSQFTTELISVEASDMFDIYYSVDAVKATTAENMNATWSAAVDDMSRVTMIKAVLKPGKTIKQDEAATLVTHNKIANDPTLKDGQKAHNSFALTVNEGTSFTETLKTEVAVHYPKKDVTLRKVDAGNQEKLLPGAVYSLYFSEGDVLVQEGITTDRNGVAVLPNLLIGKAYYLVETTAPAGYELPAAADNKLEFVVSTDVGVITATNDIARTSVSVTKIWDDVDNQDGVRPESVSVQLYADGTAQGDAIVLSEENEWKHTWADLVKKKEDGTEIVYTVAETAVPAGYEADVTGDQASGFTITNGHDPATTQVMVSKAWVGPVGNAVTIRLFADGVDTGWSVTLDAANAWSTGFADIPRYKAGKEIVYTVAEEGVDKGHYDVAITGDAKAGFTVTNTNKETRSVSASKVWNDGDNQDGVRPASISIRLLADGVEQQTKTVTVADGWKWTFENLKKYTDTGAEIVYTMTEDAVDGYTTDYADNASFAGDGTVITNTHVPEPVVPIKPEPVVPVKPEPVVPGKPTPDPKPDPGTPGKPAQATPSPQPEPLPKKGGLSKTGDATVDLVLGIMAAATASCGAAALARRRSRKH